MSGITGKDNTMRTCRYCGKRSSDDSKFCIDCGAPFDGSGENNKKTGTDFEGQAKAIFDTPDHTSKMDPNDIYTNKAMALLSYIGILVLIPLFAAKDSAYTRFHASQGLTLFIIEIAYTILNRVVMSIFGGVFIILAVQHDFPGARSCSVGSFGFRHNLRSPEQGKGAPVYRFVSHC